MKNIFRLRSLAVLCLVLALACSEAYAQGGGSAWRGSGGDGPRGGEARGRGGWHHYSNGHWYRDGLLWFDTAVSVLAIGALIDRLPPRYTTVVYAGVPYYYAEGYYYRPYDRGGYIVVQPPVIVQPAAAFTAASPDTVTINIPNSKGGFTPVVLRKAGTGYIGPQGEYYSDNPTVDQLKTLYSGK
ncbi:MAG: DUF6515 family protein [Candidatus Omnitrophota bacterium]|nr:hypothetical protein [Candidatus Omnitrophota bacterium]